MKTLAGCMLWGFIFLTLPPFPAAAEPEEPSIETLWERGEAALEEGDAEGAMGEFSDALERDRKQPRSWNYLGGVHFGRGEYGQALLYFKQAYLLNPQDVRACNNIATAYEHLGRYGKAEGYYLQAIEIDERYPVPYRNLGILYARHLQRPDQARLYWDKFLSLVPVGADSDAVREELERLDAGSEEAGVEETGRSPDP
jgi:tetratricopeptide (TPR) repeat protein